MNAKALLKTIDYAILKPDASMQTIYEGARYCDQLGVGCALAAGDHLEIHLKLAQHIQVELRLGAVNYGKQQLQFLDRRLMDPICHSTPPYIKLMIC